MRILHGGSLSARSRLLTVAFAASVLATVAVQVTTSQPAAAARFRLVNPVSWAYTDSRTPDTPYVDQPGDLPVGSWRDSGGKHHISRAYYTFDIGFLRGKRIIDATAFAAETAVNDCHTPRAVEMWRTDPVSTPPTWQQPPAERDLLYTAGRFPGEGCPVPRVEWAVANGLRQALALGHDRLTVVLRVPAGREGDVHFGRRFGQLRITMEYNTPPNTPTELRLDGKACAGEDLWLATTRPSVQAQLTDGDDGDGPSAGDNLTGTVAIWPVDRPADRIELPPLLAGSSPTFLFQVVPAGLVVPGVRYAVAVRASDAHDTSPWSAECRFIADTTPPTRAPTVTSTDYPEDMEFPGHGGPGIPGTFRFDAGGDTDVVGFRYGEDATTKFVAAAAPGGSATVTYTPTRSGPTQLLVSGVDRAGLSSPTTSYFFRVRDTAPNVVDLNPDALLGQPRQVRFEPGMDNVVEYTYQLDGGPDQTVPADVDGRATVTIVLTTPGFHTISVRSRTSDGLPSGLRSLQLSLITWPSVTSEQYPLDGTIGAPVGTPGVFVFRPRMPDVVEYVYSFNFDVEQTVAAGADGSASVTFTPTTVDTNTLYVFSRSADGTVSETGWFDFFPASIAPTVESATYPQFLTSGGPGVPGTFTFRPVAADVVEYVYQFPGEPEQTVAAGPDGTATVTWTPRSYPDLDNGWVTLFVRSRSAGGFESDLRFYTFRLNPLSPTVSVGPLAVGQPATITFTANLPGTVEYLYSFDGGPQESVTVAPGASATITWTPDAPFNHFLLVRSRTADGITSGQAFIDIWVDPVDSPAAV